MDFLKRLIEQRAAGKARIEEILGGVEQRVAALPATATREERTAAEDFTEAEDTELRDLMAADAKLEERIADLEAFSARNERVGEIADRLEGRRNGGGTSVIVRSEPRTYERWDNRTSYLLDLARRKFQRGDSVGAEARLQRHRVEIDVELRDEGVLGKLNRSQAKAFSRFVDEIREAPGEVYLEPRTEQRDADRTDGTSVGDFVPPIWLMELYAEMPRAGRPFADRIRNIPLPGGTDQINVPKITTGTATAAQTADNAAVNEQDMVTNVAQGPVRTIAGQLDVALQVLEQSPVAFDEIAFIDLTNDYDQQLDGQLLNGPGSAGTIKGLLNATGVTTTTYTDGNPTVPEFYPKLAGAISAGGTARKLPLDLIIGHLRRWMWINAALDGSNRPLSVPTSPFGGGGPNNAMAIAELASTGGIAGGILGMPWLVDLNTPITLGGSSNEDRVAAIRSQDHLLFEGNLKTRVLEEVLSGTLTVRLQVYNYAAAIFERFPAGISVIAGTGLATPSF